MADGALAANSGQWDADYLLQLAVSRPREALARARSLLAGRPGPSEALIARQAAGIVLRDTGDVGAGIRELRQALRLARRIGSAEREADVLGSLGAALVLSGRTAEGLKAFESATRLSSGALAGRVLHKRGIVLWTLGRHSAALADLRRAVSVLQRANDALWTARALNGRGLVYLAVGSPARADEDFVAAGKLHASCGQELEVAHTVLNRGWAAFRSGDLPAALALIDDAAVRYRSFGWPTPALSLDRCAVLLAAGLASDALAEAESALCEIEQTRGSSIKRAELLLMAASCALAAAQPHTALERARAAHRLFRSQQSAWGQAHAKLVLVQAQYTAGPVSGRTFSAATHAAADLTAVGSAEATQAHLLAGRVAMHLGRRADADRHFATAALSRRRGPAISRVAGWLAEALRAQAAGDSRQLQIACRRGLEVLDEYRWTLGASELRAQATAQGAELAALAQRHVAAMRRPRLLLTWSERWRATALAVPAVRPPAGDGFDADLAALRQATSRLEEARRQGMPTVSLEREQQRLEKAVRATSLRTRGSAVPAHRVIDIGELLDHLGGVQLVEIVDINGTLNVLLCGAGRVRQVVAGKTADAVRAADFARFALRRIARARPADDPDSAAAILKAAGPQLQEAVLGPASGLLGDGPLIVIPPGRLHAIPWAVLPALASRPFSVAPSAGAWLRASSAPGARAASRRSRSRARPGHGRRRSAAGG